MVRYINKLDCETKNMYEVIAGEMINIQTNKLYYIDGNFVEMEEEKRPEYNKISYNGVESSFNTSMGTIVVLSYNVFDETFLRVHYSKFCNNINTLNKKLNNGMIETLNQCKLIPWDFHTGFSYNAEDNSGWDIIKTFPAHTYNHVYHNTDADLLRSFSTIIVDEADMYNMKSGLYIGYPNISNLNITSNLLHIRTSLLYKILPTNPLLIRNYVGVNNTPRDIFWMKYINFKPIKRTDINISWEKDLERVLFEPEEIIIPESGKQTAKKTKKQTIKLQDVKRDAKADAKTEVKADAKRDAKAEVKADTKAEVKADAKAEVKNNSEISDQIAVEKMINDYITYKEIPEYDFKQHYNDIADKLDIKLRCYFSNAPIYDDFYIVDVYSKLQLIDMNELEFNAIQNNKDYKLEKTSGRGKNKIYTVSKHVTFKNANHFALSHVSIVYDNIFGKLKELGYSYILYRSCYEKPVKYIVTNETPIENFIQANRYGTHNYFRIPHMFNKQDVLTCNYNNIKYIFLNHAAVKMNFELYIHLLSVNTSYRIVVID